MGLSVGFAPRRYRPVARRQPAGCTVDR